MNFFEGRVFQIRKKFFLRLNALSCWWGQTIGHFARSAWKGDVVPDISFSCSLFTLSRPASTLIKISFPNSAFPESATEFTDYLWGNEDQRTLFSETSGDFCFVFFFFLCSFLVHGLVRTNFVLGGFVFRRFACATCSWSFCTSTVSSASSAQRETSLCSTYSCENRVLARSVQDGFQNQENFFSCLMTRWHCSVYKLQRYTANSSCFYKYETSIKVSFVSISLFWASTWKLVGHFGRGHQKFFSTVIVFQAVPFTDEANGGQNPMLPCQLW